MDLPLLECVPNVSAGRDVVLVDGLGDVVRDGLARGARIDGSRAVLADVHRDSDHDRSVFTIIGSGAALAGALEALARAAVERIDLHAGHGVHPRVGVLDVLPVVPLEESSAVARSAAHALCRRLAHVLGDELGVPVVRYGLDETGAAIEGAEHTGAVRRGGPASVTERIESGELELLAGPRGLHESAGATICGVRDLLVAFNVELDVDDLELARAIARQIRGTAGTDDALPGVRALGLRLPSRGVVQVSTNIDRYRTCGPARVLRAVAAHAQVAGAARVAAAELVGLAPATALAELRYACTTLGVPLRASAQPDLARHLDAVRKS